MQAYISVLIAGLLLPLSAAAQGQTGTIHHAQWGVTFTMPDGWVGQLGSEGYLFGSHTERGIVMVMPHSYSSPEALRAEAQKGLSDGMGTHLTVDGTVQPFGERGVQAAFRGQLQGQAAQAYAVSVIGPSGGGITVLTATEPAYYSEAYARHVEQIARSIQFSPPKATPTDASWASRLNGSRLTALSSYYSGGPTGAYVGSSEKTVIDLCSAGHFFYHDSRSLAVDGGMGSGYNASGYGGGREQGSGQWTVRQQGAQPVLQLTFPSGEVATYTITYPDEELHLNGTRFYWTTHRSPAEYRPQCP